MARDPERIVPGSPSQPPLTRARLGADDGKLVGPRHWCSHGRIDDGAGGHRPDSVGFSQVKSLGALGRHAALRGLQGCEEANERKIQAALSEGTLCELLPVEAGARLASGRE